MQTTTALRFIIDSMGQIPGRKSMVVLSDSMPGENQDPEYLDDFGMRSTVRLDYTAMLQKIAEQLSRGATLTLSQSEYEQALQHGIALTIDMPVKKPGAYQVRVAARDRKSSRIGSTGQFVAVPDLSKNRLGVSGIVLGTEDASSSQGAGTMGNPGMRRFAQNSRLYFAYMLYNVLPSQNLVSEAKLFRDGKNVFSGPEIPIDTAKQKDNRTRVCTRRSSARHGPRPGKLLPANCSD